VTRVVVADDTPDITRLIVTALTARKYECFAARDGLEAWTMVQKEEPDLAILDMSMPGLDGLEVCRKIRNDPRLRHIGIIFLTAYDQLDMKVTAFQAGADDYMLKPFVPNELLLRVEAVLKRQVATGAAVPVLPVAKERGNVLAVVGTKGGAGASSLAVNIAVASVQLGRRTCLIDLGLERSLDACLLDLSAPPRAGWDAVMGETNQDIWAALEDRLMTHSSGLSVLIGPSRYDEVDRVSGSQMTTWLELLRQQFDQVVVDLVCGFRDSNLDVFEFSDHLVVVATPDLPTVRLLQAMTSVLDQLGIPQRKVSLVLNQPALIPSLSAADVQRYVKLPIQSEIPYGGPILRARTMQAYQSSSALPPTPLGRRSAIYSGHLPSPWQAIWGRTTHSAERLVGWRWTRHLCTPAHAIYPRSNARVRSVAGSCCGRLTHPGEDGSYCPRYGESAASLRRSAGTSPLSSNAFR